MIEGDSIDVWPRVYFVLGGIRPSLSSLLALLRDAVLKFAATHFRFDSGPGDDGKDQTARARGTRHILHRTFLATIKQG